jgi:hypothetical protein
MLSYIVLIISGFAYLIVAIEQAMKGNIGLTIAFVGYVISTIGYLLMTK